MTRLLEHLNEPQREVVLHGDGPMLVLAGAGSGKTRAITHRIAHLILERNVYPEQIIAVTFTNKAAAEMRERVDHLLQGQDQAPTWMATFHSACARILRYDGRHIGIPRGFTIFDDDDQKRMIKTMVAELQLPTDEIKIADYKAFIERARNQGWLPKQAHEVSFGRQQEMKANLYSAYHERMRANGTLDFGDLLLATIELLETNQDVRERYQYQYRHVLVDEFQDTNPAQYKLLRLLTGPPHNLVVVGDDDQSIYAWRGAAVTNLLGFEHDFETCNVVRLEQNYRSTQPILDLANAIISVNRGRKAKKLWTDRTGGEVPSLFTARDDREEAQYVSREIERFTQSSNFSYGDLAIFYRTNSQSRVYEEQLRRFGIPYRVVAGTSFYAREEIKDVLGYLRAAVNPADAVAVLRIINVPKRGCGKKALAHLNMLAEVERVPLADAIPLLADDRSVRVRSNARDALKELHELLEELRGAANHWGPVQCVQWLLDTIGYKDYLLNKHPENAVDRWDNVSELINAMAAYEEDVRKLESDNPTVAGFLERAALVQANDTELDQGAVSLMTIHAAKGLEYPVVFVTGLEDGSMPLIRGSNGEADDMEEERRLCYVAVTRAKEHLILSNCLNRRVFGTMTRRRHSPFLDGAAKDFYRRNRKSASGSFSTARDSSSFRRPEYNEFDPRQYPNPEDFSQVEVDYDNVPPDGIRFTRPSMDDGSLGTYVGRVAHHKTFGAGRITAAEYSGDKVKLTIDFATVGTKKVISRFVEIV